MPSSRNDWSSVVRSEYDAVSVIPGVGPSLAGILERGLSIRTLGDVIRHYPIRYEDRSVTTPISKLLSDEYQVIQGTVGAVTAQVVRRGISVVKVKVDDESGSVELVFFNQFYQKARWEQLSGHMITAAGKATQIGRHVQMTDIEWEAVVSGKEGIISDRIVPIYPLTEGLSQLKIRQLQHRLAEKVMECFPDFIPLDLCRRNGLISRGEALQAVHWPQSFLHLEAARRRITFDEYLVLQVILATRKAQKSSIKGIAFRNWKPAIEELRSVLPYPLTAAQDRVIDEIGQNMAAGQVMHRLLQGDVGCGKSCVALAAMLIAVRNSFQAAIMVPLEVLADQHYRLLSRMANRLDLSVGLLTGSLSEKARAELIRRTCDGTIDVLVGTHALFQTGVKFKRLGLAIVDEQHRFGVVQRNALQEKGVHPHLLVMTATPIPRSLSLTIYGDLDISVIDELPGGRRPITTHWKKTSEREKVYETLQTLLRQGHQAYIVCSRVEQDENAELIAATEYHKSLSARLLPPTKVGLIHGKMGRDEKERVMAQFRRGELSVLVATTVIEVGVDVPNASVIVVEDADRFGLSQLHQLRGRVGRGSSKSYCILISDGKTLNAEQRLRTLQRTSDGFIIAEEDLKLRGPGDYFGTRQSGAPATPTMRIADNLCILNEARDEAQTLIGSGDLNRPEYSALRLVVSKREERMAEFAIH